MEWMYPSKAFLASTLSLTCGKSGSYVGVITVMKCETSGKMMN
jgi:hypothetical protein